MAYLDTDTSCARWRVALIVLAIVVVATFAWAADEEARVVLHAETQRGTADGWHGEGDVQIIYQDIDIQCDVADWNRATGEVVARGNVILDRGPSRFTAEEARFNILTKTGVFFNATAFIDPMYTFTGREIEKLDETHYRIDRATFTTCSTDGRPPWSFHVHKAKVEQEGLGHFSSSAMKIRGVPVFYMPYMVWPIKKERAAGLLRPRQQLAVGTGARCPRRDQSLRYLGQGERRGPVEDLWQTCPGRLPRISAFGPGRKSVRHRLLAGLRSQFRRQHPA
jgi:LPS-assembly protein